jgi:lipopolysaccharide export system permease protein
MGKIYRYLLGDFFKTFITYFLILFFLVSIVYFVRIAGYTAVMSMSFSDIFAIYFYYVPQIIIYTFPLTYFIAMVISLYNFSKDGEMLVLFSLGKSPKSVINLYLLLSFIISISLIVNSLILMPLSEQASHNFLKIKKVESKINVKSSEIGQKVGNWHIFTKRADDFVYNDLVLFSANYKNKEQLILSKSAKFDSFGDSISLTLRDGVHYMIGNDRIVQTNFETLKLTNAIYKDKLDNKTILEYWLDAKTDKYRSRWLTIYMLLSLFPLLSLFLAFSVGIINTRVQRRVVSFWMALVVIVYYGFTFKIAEISPLYGGVGFLTIFLLVSFLVVRKMILKRY